MHERLTPEDIRLKLKKIIHQTKKLLETAPNIKPLVFVDELNTSSIPGFMKEIFIEKSIDGEKKR